MDARKSRERLLGPALRTQPDRRLVVLARAGNEAAKEEIVRRYRGTLVGYAGSIVGAAAAEDVVQEALAKGTAALGRAADGPRLRPWLYAIVRNTALNHLRDAGPATEQLDENYDGVEQPPQALERRERVRSLVGGLRRLPQQQREALVKRELEGRSHAEIGAELGVSSGAARQLIFRARESLRVGFGSLLPMPLLRWLAEGGGDGAVGVAAGAGGGAMAAKAAVAIFATGAAVTAGVAIDHSGRQRPVEPPAAEAALKPATPALSPGDGGSPDGSRREPVVESSSGEGGSGDRHGDSGSGNRDSSSDSGPGNDQTVNGGSGGPGPSRNAGSGSDDSDGHGERSGHSGSGRSGSGDGGGSGSSRSGRDGGSGTSGGGDDGGSDGGHGGDDGGSTSGVDGGSGGGGGDDGGGDVVATAAPAPSSSGSGSGSTTTAPVEGGSEGSSSGRSGRSGSGETFSEPSRDLSGSSVSQGSEVPD